MTLRSLSFHVKVLFSCFLITVGIGYLFAVIYLYLIDLEPHAKMGISTVQAVIIKYYGKHGGSRLEVALNGSMGENIPPEQKKTILQWIQKGAGKSEFTRVQPLFIKYCAICHNKEAGQLSPLTTYEEVKTYTQMEMGESVKRLVRVSHVHLFGISVIFLLTGGIFVFSEISSRWRTILVTIPFAAIWIDIGSWWFTKLEPLFAYTVIMGGILMGSSLAVQIVLSLYEMWFKKADC